MGFLCSRLKLRQRSVGRSGMREKDSTANHEKNAEGGA